MFVIFSKKETERDGELMFWSNEFGWTMLIDATLFHDSELEKIHMPIGGSDVLYLPKELGD